jgi:HlyD family secretion protein
VLAVVAVLIAVGAGLAFWWPHSNVLRLQGLLQAREIKNASSFGGRVTATLVQEGDWVNRGAVLVHFDDREIRAQLASAQAALIQAEARLTALKNGASPQAVAQAQARVKEAAEQLALVRKGPRLEELTQADAQVQQARVRAEQAKQQVENAQALLLQGVASQQQLDDAESQWRTTQSALKSVEANAQLLKKGARPEQIQVVQAQLSAAQASLRQLQNGASKEDIQIAEAAVVQAQSALDSLKAKVSETILRAPIAGVVSVLNTAPGELVPPARPVVSILDTTRLWTDVYLPESQLGRIRVGQPILLRSPAVARQTFQGRVAFINPKSEFVPNNSQRDDNGEEPAFRVKIVVTLPTGQPPALLPGMRVELDLPPAP